LSSDDPYAAAAASAAVLAERTGQREHDVAIVLGSGWAPAADALAAGPPDATSAGAAGPAGDARSAGHARPAGHGQPAEHAATEVPLADLGGFPPPTVPGHSPVVRSLAIGGHRVLVFLGRTHLYEGHPVQTVVHGVRTAVAAGCRVVVLTNAAGGIRAGYQVGQPVLIRDHLNLTARSPLTGSPPPDGYPSRFTDLTGLYSPRLRELAHRANPGLAEGVYAALPGPHYETPAEIAMLRGLGADLVGMSTVLEAIAARHLGAEVLAISLVTNLAAGLAPSGLDHQEVIAAGRAASARMGALLAAILPGIG
jgi:purine-nucleoside phosphorylase